MYPLYSTQNVDPVFVDAVPTLAQHCLSALWFEYRSLGLCYLQLEIPMVAQCWANIVDVGPTLIQHWLIYGICRDVILDGLNTVTVYCRSGHFRVRLDFREFVILGLYTKSRIHKLSIKMIGSAILQFANLSSSRNSRELKLC